MSTSQPHERGTPTSAPGTGDTLRLDASSREAHGSVLLVASDGERPAGAAIRMAEALSHGGRRAVELLVVMDRMSFGVPEGILTPEVLDSDPVLEGTVLAQVRRQLHAVPGTRDWTVRVEAGRTAATIVRAASRCDAELIVVGLTEHSPLATLAGGETVLRILRHTDVPLLAVHPLSRSLPATIVAAVDFGRSSLRAVHLARRLMGAAGRLHLLHVRPPMDRHALTPDGWDTIYSEGVRSSFEELVDALQPSEQLRVTTEVLRGPVAETILDRATALDADLICMGSNSHPLIDRLLIGTTPTRVLKEARTSVLVAPPRRDRERARAD